ncbi:MAG: DUF4410 domain-containing protein [Acidobacteria bacterium]|nr:MAG: DUF4410 domain-containing protein [Acidobacteriota bacterium]
MGGQSGDGKPDLVRAHDTGARIRSQYSAVPGRFQDETKVLEQTLCERGNTSVRKISFVALLVAIGMLGVNRTARPEEATVKDKYHAIEAAPMEVQPGVQVPAEYLQKIQDETIKQLKESKRFTDVLASGENPPDAASPVLRLTGTITHYKPGSRAKRYLIGYGVGSTEIYAHLVFQDRTTGATVITQEVKAVLTSGLGGGKSSDVARDFARHVVTSTKLILEKRLPAEAETSASAPTGSAALPPAPPDNAISAIPASVAPATVAAATRERSADRRIVTIQSGKFEDAEQELNSAAASGFRMARFAVTGRKSAEVTMEKTASPGLAYQYRLLHVMWIPTLQKELNERAADGFRLCPHTLAQLRRASAIVIMEKPPIAPDTLYGYRVHATMRVSSAQKDIQKDQSDGFTLAETTEGGAHIVILEKAMPKSAQ